MKLSGHRTYLVVIVALGYLAGVKLGYWPADQQIIAGLGFAAVAFLRAGINTNKPPTAP